MTAALPHSDLPHSDIPTVYVIHDNPEWIPPFANALHDEGVPFVEWLLPGTAIDLSEAPPRGLFWSRLSASSHTRTDPHVKEYGRAVLAWLEAAGRTVVNGSAVYELEVSKVRQHRALQQRGFDTPRTAAVFGPHALEDTARTFAPPFITKHNQGGKGLGVRRFDSHGEFSAVAHEFAPDGDNAPIDGITLVQEYVQPAQPFVTRAEFIGGRFHYAVRVDVSDGSFELCPADACTIPQPGLAPAVCAVPGAGSGENASSGENADGGGIDEAAPFSRRDDITAETPLIRDLELLLAELGVLIAGVEFIETADGRRVVYDINTNTNYNPAVEEGERDAGREPAAHRIARLLGEMLEEQREAVTQHSQHSAAVTS